MSCLWDKYDPTKVRGSDIHIHNPNIAIIVPIGRDEVDF